MHSGTTGSWRARDVEGIVVVTIGLRQEAVVGGIVDGAVQHAVEEEQARALVQLVFHLGALGISMTARK
jgi:hypothetical protein